MKTISESINHLTVGYIASFMQVKYSSKCFTEQKLMKYMQRKNRAMAKTCFKERL